MPTYLCHGFRWTRRLIRVFVVLENIDEAAPDWIIGSGSSRAILERLITKFDFLPRRLPTQPPEQQRARQQGKEPIHQDDDLSVPPSRVPSSRDNVLAHSWSPVKLLEEYDPEETRISARPFGYVADHAIRIDLSASLTEEMAKYDALVKQRNEGDWLERLRDELQDDAPIGWYVVVNGDEERAAPDSEDGYYNPEDEGGEPTVERPTTAGIPSQSRAKGHQQSTGQAVQQPSLRHKMSRAGLRRLFRRKDAPE